MPGPYDGEFPAWRSGENVFEQATSYGNFAGPENRNDIEHPATPYQPIDPMDAAAAKHDAGYARDLGSWNPFTNLAGMNAVREDDRTLVSDVNKEMNVNGEKYSPAAQTYSEGLRGFFGGRVDGEDAIDWAGAKVSQAEQGGVTPGFLAQAGGEAIGGIEQAAKTASGLGVVGGVGTAIGLGEAALAGTEQAASSLFGHLFK